jgi:predicted Zn-dependent peptidase
MIMNNGSGVLGEAHLTTMFTTMPFGRHVIGFASDLESIRKEDAMSFFKKYYVPNNTIIVINGNINPKETYDLVNKYYGNIPQQQAPKPFSIIEPPQKGERRTEVEFDTSPQIRIGFHGPKPGSQDQYALEIIQDILNVGLTGRFQENIVKKNLATGNYAGLWVLGYTTTFNIVASPMKNVTTSQLEEAIYKELDRLKNEPVTQWELQKIHNHIDRGFISRLKSKYALSSQLAYNQSFTGDWRNFDDRAKLKAVTPQDIMRVAKKYFVKSNRTVVTLVPTKNISK